MAQQTQADDSSTELETTISIKWTGDARLKMSSRGIIPAYEDGAEWAATAKQADDEYKSLLKLRTQEDVDAILTALDRCHLSRSTQGTTWYTGAHKRAFTRVMGEILEAVKEQGASVDGTGRGAPTIEWPQDEQEQAEDVTTVGDLIAQDPAEYHRQNALQMTEKQQAVVQHAQERPEATPAEVAEAEGCTTRYVTSVCSRFDPSSTEF